MGSSVCISSFLTRLKTELKGTSSLSFDKSCINKNKMELTSQLLKSALIFLVICGLISVEASPHKEVKEWMKKIKDHHFLTKCWGEGTMMAFYKASEKFGMECMQLTPAFDIDLFAEPDNEEYNMVGDEMENPFFGTAPAGTQQYQQQQQARSFQYFPNMNVRSKRAIDPPT